ncbi:MAG: cation:proton antiporter [Candidatus Sungbacteria bacterium]|uniref:Cation:proton antiporter n=1 Tax=Candidatus Sungiibacteriota bacterium TaxID=2750080 RepID=A0A931SB31_9BACT|nr:cation:proton antiporter [Candidatus Sungbacteria bacterium]
MSGTLQVFGEVSLLVAIATLVALGMRLLKQPLIIGHIITGLLLGPLVFDLIKSQETLQLFSRLGVALLLFIVGLSLSPKVIREIGRVAVLTGLGQVVITSFAGFIVSQWLGFSVLTSLYIGVALSFSSTIIILKLISDKGDLDKLYARISIGFLLVQDLIAVGLLFFIPLISQSGLAWGGVAAPFIKAVVLAVALFGISYYLLPRLHLFIGRSQELLFLFANAWGMGVAALFQHFGFPLESGALIAGVALSNLPSRQEISSRLAPLRDFFIVIFFILLGSQLVVGDLRGILYPVIILSALVLAINPIILMTITGALGYRKRVSWDAGVTVAEISEFSLILMLLGVSLGHVAPQALALVTAVGLLTIFGSTYLVLYSADIYGKISRYLSVFERGRLNQPEGKTETNYELLLFGYNRIGYDFLRVFRHSGKSFLVVDYDPEVARTLSLSGLSNIYGDAGDAEFLASLNLKTVRLAVSTIPDAETNQMLLSRLRPQNPGVIFIAVAHRIEDALSLYQSGANFVIMPHFLGGKYAADIVSQYWFDAGKFNELRKEHLESLADRIREGHEHPVVRQS